MSTDILRKAVIKSTSLWPLSSINRQVYELAVKAFALQCTRFGQLQSLYVKHKNWVPGLSDIDLVAVLKNCGDIGEEFAFLRRFWSVQRWTQRWLPMLRDIDVVRSQYFETQTRFSIQGYDAHRWVWVYGSRLGSAYPPSSHRVVVDSTNYAVSLYCSYFSRALRKKSRSPYVAALVLQRFARKILRYTHYAESLPPGGSEAPQDKEAAVLANPDKVEVVCRVVESLDRRVRGLNHGYCSQHSPIDTSGLPFFGDVSQRCLNFGRHTGNDVPRGLESVILGCAGLPDLFIIVENDLRGAALRACIRTALGRVNEDYLCPILLTRRCFAYLLQVSEPLIYVRMLKHRVLLAGTDMVASLEPPSRNFFIASLQSYAVAALTSAQSRSAVARDRGELSALLWLLRIRLYLEGEMVDDGGDERLLELVKTSHPRLRQLFGDLRREQHSPSPCWYRRRFALQKKLADDLHGLLSKANPEISLPGLLNRNHCVFCGRIEESESGNLKSSV